MNKLIIIHLLQFPSKLVFVNLDYYDDCGWVILIILVNGCI